MDKPPPHAPAEPKSSRDSTLELIGRHRSGDRGALPALFDRHYASVERIVRVRLGRQLQAEHTVADVVQSVFLRVLDGIDDYREQDDARWIEWVARLAQNEICNLARRTRARKRGGGATRTVPLDPGSGSYWDVPAPTTSVSGKAARREEAAILDGCLSGLPEAQREVILLRDYAGADWTTVAESMGRPSPEACQELHRRARKELLRRLHGRI